jgi:hypothetical protein
MLGPVRYVFPLIRPGSELVEVDPKHTIIIKCLSLLESELRTAAVALNLYEEWRDDQFAAAATRRPKLMSVGRPTVDEIEANRVAWERGEWPEIYRITIGPLLEDAFICAVAAFQRAGGELMTVAPGDAVSRLVGITAERYPKIKDIRDSVMHGDDRVFRRGRQGHKKSTLPDAPVIITRSSGDGLASVELSDGTHATVTVDAEGLDELRGSLQAVYNNFEWRGHARSLIS